MATHDAQCIARIRETEPTPDGWRQFEKSERACPVGVQLPTVPDQIPRDTLRDICRTLGLDPSDVREVRLGINEITATLYLRNSDGFKIRYGEGPATVVVTIPIG